MHLNLNSTPGTPEQEHCTSVTPKKKHCSPCTHNRYIGHPVPYTLTFHSAHPVYKLKENYSTYCAHGQRYKYSGRPIWISCTVQPLYTVYLQSKDIDCTQRIPSTSKYPHPLPVHLHKCINIERKLCKDSYSILSSLLVISLQIKYGTWQPVSGSAYMPGWKGTAAHVNLV